MPADKPIKMFVYVGHNLHNKDKNIDRVCCEHDPDSSIDEDIVIVIDMVQYFTTQSSVIAAELCPFNIEVTYIRTCL